MPGFVCWATYMNCVLTRKNINQDKTLNRSFAKNITLDLALFVISMTAQFKRPRSCLLNSYTSYWQGRFELLTEVIDLTDLLQAVCSSIRSKSSHHKAKRALFPAAFDPFTKMMQTHQVGGKYNKNKGQESSAIK